MYDLSYFVFGCLAITLLNILVPLANNIRIARATGVPYVIVPVYAYNRIKSVLFARIVLRVFDSILSQPSTTSWRRLTGSAWPWKLRHTPFADLGTDIFLTVAPGGIILHTADAGVIAQINARGNDFPKATQIYKHIDIYGKNVVSSGGEIWRRHRAVTSTAFTEKNNQIVWKETLDIAQNILKSWTPSKENEKTIRTVASDSMRLSLEVIGRAVLGQRLELSKPTEMGNEERVLTRGHKLNFTEALQLLLVHIFYVIALPVWFLKNSPFKKLNQSYEAYIEWGKYLEEMIAAKKEAFKSEKPEVPGVDLIGQLLKAQRHPDNSGSEPDQPTSLSDTDVMGNLFMFIIAGHETSANSIHFSILLLALNPSIQRKVQHQLSTIFQDRPVSTWSYESDFPRLLNSILAAVLNEELRLIGPVIAIPKTVNSTPQQLSINNRDCVLPANTMIRLCIPSVHCNPKYWPLSPPKNPQNPAFPLGNPDNDVEEFKPERWLRPTSQKYVTTRSSSASAMGLPLYSPPKGAFIPFSDGQRACLGKRFAQVEILAALAVIFSQYSVELAVDEWASYEQIAEMGKEDRRRVWAMAEAKAKNLLRDKVVSIITLQMRGAHVPVRFVSRGAEMFGDL